MALAEADPAARIRELSPDGVDRIVEVDLASSVTLDAAVAASGAVVAAYASSAPTASVPFFPLMLYVPPAGFEPAT